MDMEDRCTGVDPTKPGFETDRSDETSSSTAVEKDSVEYARPSQLQRRLQSRHLQMIAIGGTIGTGLFIGSGSALAHAGPAGALIAYAFVGSLVCSVMVALGEMATFMPLSAAFTAFATRFVDPSLGFAQGWIYWFSFAITYATELTASGLIIQYWRPDLNMGIFVGSFWGFLTAINLLPVSCYGEIEFWMSMIKVLTVVGFFIFGICVDAGVGQQNYLGFHMWKHPGAFAPYLVTDDIPLAKFVGFWSVMIQAGFSYQGTELVGIAAGEAHNPRKNVPAAIRKTFWRIALFYVLSILMVGLLVPYDNPDLLNGETNGSSSPFVLAAKLAGIKVLPSFINAILLIVVLSAGNADIYVGSRMLLGLAREGHAPMIVTRTTRQGVPYIAVMCTAAFGLLGFLNESESGATAFNWLISISAVAGYISWTCIGISHIAFMRALRVQGISRDSLAYKAMWQPWFSWYGVMFNTLIIITQGFTAFIPWDTSDFFIAYISVILFVVLYVGHKLVTRRPFVKPNEVDLVTDVREIDEMIFEDKRPSTWYGKIWMCMME